MNEQVSYEDLEPFLEIINKIATNINAICLKEDVRNDLIELLINKLPYINKMSNGNIDEAQAIATVMFKNNLINRIKYYKRRPDTWYSYEVTDCINGEKNETNAHIRVGNVVFNDDLMFEEVRNYSTPFEILLAKETKVNVLKWLKCKHKNRNSERNRHRRLFILMALRPSRFIQEKFDEMISTNKNYKMGSTCSIPLVTLGKILNIPEFRIYQYIREMKKVIKETD